MPFFSFLLQFLLLPVVCLYIYICIYDTPCEEWRARKLSKTLRCEDVYATSFVCRILQMKPGEGTLQIILKRQLSPLYSYVYHLKKKEKKNTVHSNYSTPSLTNSLPSRTYEEKKNRGRETLTWALLCRFNARVCIFIHIYIIYI